MTMLGWLMGLVQAGVGTGLAAALLCLLDRPLRRRLPARWFCAAWLILTLRLLAPLPLPGLVQLPMPQGVWTLLAQAEGAAGAPGQGEPENAGRPADQSAAGTADSPQQSESPVMPVQDGAARPADGTVPAGLQEPAEQKDGNPAGRGGRAVRWLFAVWAAGAALTLAGQLWGSATLYKKLQRWGTDPGESVRRSAAREAAALGVNRDLRLVQSEEGPLVVGLIRPILALPAELEAEGSRGDLLLILRHELAHLARRDLAFKALLAAAGALHWFNPLVWWMVRRASAELELACDDLATRGASTVQRQAYGEAILAMALRKGGRSAPLLSTGFWGGKRRLRRRFENLTGSPAGKRWAMGVGVGLAALLLAGSWGLGAVTASGRSAPAGLPDAAGAQGAPLVNTEDPDAAGLPEDGWNETVVDFARNGQGTAAPVLDETGEKILEMRCELPDGPDIWQPENPAVKMQLLLPDGWGVHPAADGEEIYASGAGIQAPFNLTDARGDWVGTMQYGWFTSGQTDGTDGFYGGGKHGAYFWLWARPEGYGWDETSYRAAAGDAMLEDPAGAGAALCETTGKAQAGHEGILAHDGALGRFVAIELRAGVLSEQERLRLAQSIQLLAGDAQVETVPGLPDLSVLPAGYVWQELKMAVTGAPTDSAVPNRRVTVRLALPEDCRLEPEAAGEESGSGGFDPLGAGVRILRGEETVGRIGCNTFASAAPVDWPAENPREIYAYHMLGAHMGWDYDYQEIARSETMSIATCLVGREAYPRGPGPEAPSAGQEPENYRDGWWYQKGILCSDNTLGVYAAIELEYGDFSDAVREKIAQSVRLLPADE